MTSVCVYKVSLESSALKENINGNLEFLRKYQQNVRPTTVALIPPLAFLESLFSHIMSQSYLSLLYYHLYIYILIS